jgi:threonyl-tRNA synthetase
MLEGVHLTRCGAATHHGGPTLLQRMYGIAFPDMARLREWKARQEEAKARDHRYDEDLIV